MPLIPTIDPKDATGDLAAIYETIGGNVDNILRIQSLSPKTLEGHFKFYRSIMFSHSDLRTFCF